MVSIAQTLPDNIEDLKEKVTSLSESNNSFETENNILREQVRLLKAQLFGRKTEKSSPDSDNGQALLFNEAEAFSSVEEKVKEDVEIKAHKRKKRGRRPLPADLHRSTMCGWAIKVADRCKPLLDLLNKEIRSDPLINIDETTVQVMKEPNRSNKTKS